MHKFLILTTLIAISAVTADAQDVSFVDDVYPVFQRADCADCHTPTGVASATRLHFPEEDASLPQLEAFGRSLVELVDQNSTEKSLLWTKPTARVDHEGDERVAKSSPEETALRGWIEYLGTLDGADLADALRYKEHQALGYGETPKVVLRRLTHSQYNNTVRDLLQDITNPADRFPPEGYVNGFRNQYEALSISPILAEAYSLAAERLAANAFRRGDSLGLIPCEPVSDDDAVACRQQFVETFGRKAFRRPLGSEEIAGYQALFEGEKTFLEGAQTVIEAMLQSPSFLFWLDQAPYDNWKPFATASRLSYSLWDSMPDEALMENAARGDLNTPEGLEAEIRRMLADPKAAQGLNEFVSQWLRFDRVMTATRDRRLFPLFNTAVASSMAEEAKRFIGHLVWNDQNFMDVFTADYSLVNSELASVYQISPPNQDWERVEFPRQSERSGLLGQALFLTLTSNPGDTAPTGRGLFVREQFLCQQVPEPPPGVSTDLPPIDQSKPVTNRVRLAMHTSNPTCVSCHKLTDSIGFGFEKFDAIGMRREQHKLLFYPEGDDGEDRDAKPTEVLLDLDTSASVAGIKDSQFSSPVGLGELLARTPQCQECVVKQLFQYFAGRQATPADRPLLHQGFEDFRNSGFHFKELVVSLIKGREFPAAGRGVSVLLHE